MVNSVLPVRSDDLEVTSIEPAVYWDVMSHGLAADCQHFGGLWGTGQPDWVKQPVTMKCQTRNEPWNTGIAKYSVG